MSSMNKSFPPPLTNLNLNLKLLTKKLFNVLGLIEITFQSDPVGVKLELVFALVAKTDE